LQHELDITVSEPLAESGATNEAGRKKRRWWKRKWRLRLWPTGIQPGKNYVDPLPRHGDEE
jgi:hypothetical protein